MENSLNSALLEAYKTIEKISGAFDTVDQKIIAISKNARAMVAVDPEKLSPKEVNTRLQKTVETTSQLNALVKEQNNLEKQLVTQLAKKQAALSNTNKELIKQRLETQLINKEAKNSAVLNSKLTTEYQKLNVKLNMMIQTYKDLAAKRVQGIALSKKEESQFKRLESQIRKTDTALKGIDRAVGQNFRNVGNYGSALKGLGGSLRSLASAFGLTSGVYLFAGAVKDAFNRVREFDKSMQNLAGVMRVTREDLGDLESTIISVAGASVRTSNEVAKLAESLATLGKTKDEIKDLLKPVIDLSLGLDAPADEAGQFLVQMLNTFGKGTDSAVEFADTIATIRTSTTLDFQKMRDSFQYIAPISRILNKDLAYTGSVVGILADNGLKAESAGRLLSTALIKLATTGKTLPQALDEINQLYKEGGTELEILAKANDLFGKQSAKVGAILALNTDAIEANAQAIRDNGGALDDLVNQQLESLDARLKILDSTYESFILNLDNGNSIIGKITKELIHLGSVGIKSLEIASNNAGTALKAVFGVLTFNSEIVKSASEDITYLGEKISDTTKEIEKQNKAFIKLHGSLAPLTQSQQDLIDKQVRINALFGNAANGFGSLIEEQDTTIKGLRDQIKALKDEIEDLDKTDKEGVKKRQDKIKSLQDELDAILGVTKGTKEQNNALKDSLKYYKEQISKLEELRDTTALTNEEYDSFNEQIKVLQFNVDELTGAYDDFLDSLEKPLPTPSFNDLFKKQDTPVIGFVNIDENDWVKEANDKYEEDLKNHEEFLRRKEELNQKLYSNIESFAVESFKAIFEAEVNKYEDRIDANNDYYDALLKNEELTDKQKAGLEEERERKNAELDKKKKEAQKKGFIVAQLAALGQVAISTAKAAVAAYEPPPVGLGPLGGNALLPLIIANGALQAGIIAAQTIPQFKEGHLEGNYEGLAMINDAPTSNYREIVERKDGFLEMFSGKNQVIQMEKGDRVHKAGTFEPSKILQNGLALSAIDHENKINRIDAQVSNTVQKEILSTLKKKNFSPVIKINAKDIDYRKLAQAMNLEREANKA